MNHRSQIPIKIAIDGKPVRSSTLATSVGAYTLVLETVLPDQAIDLHSIYTGHANVKTQVIHLVLTPDLREATTVEHDHDQLPVMHCEESAYTTTCTNSKTSCKATVSTSGFRSTTTRSKPSSAESNLRRMAILEASDERLEPVSVLKPVSEACRDVVGGG
jgi:hypothetical protein